MDDDERLGHTKWSANSRNEVAAAQLLVRREAFHRVDGRLTAATWVRFERLQN